MIYLLVRIREQTAGHVRCVSPNSFAFNAGVIFHTQWINSNFVIKSSIISTTDRIVNFYKTPLAKILQTNPQATKFPEGAKAQAITLVTIESIINVKKKTELNPTSTML